MPKTYLIPGGAELFKKKTSFLFSRRNNRLLTAIDEYLIHYPKIPGGETVRRTGHLLELTTLARHWINSKGHKVDSGKASRRYPFVRAVLDEAIAEMKNIRAAKDGWNKLRDARAKLVPNGSAPRKEPNAPPMKHLTAKTFETDPAFSGWKGDNNWLEALDPDHHRGHEISEQFEVWANSEQETRSFWEFLKDDDQKALLPDDKQVRYLEDHALRTLFEVEFRNGRMYSRMSSELQTQLLGLTEKKSLTELYDLAGDAVPLTTARWPSRALHGLTDGWACYVLSPQKVAYMGAHIGGVFHHSSFLRGAPVLAAGMIRVANGIPVEIHEKNGHYQAKQVHLQTFLQFLKDNMPGLDLYNLRVISFDGTRSAMAATILGLPPRPQLPQLPPRQFYVD